MHLLAFLISPQLSTSSCCSPGGSLGLLMVSASSQAFPALLTFLDTTNARCKVNCSELWVSRGSKTPGHADVCPRKIF